MFPAPLPLMMGWLLHFRTCSRGQMLTTVISVPWLVMSFWQGLEHSWHVLKSSRRQLSKTRNWRSFSGAGGLDAVCPSLEWDYVKRFSQILGIHTHSLPLETFGRAGWRVCCIRLCHAAVSRRHTVVWHLNAAGGGGSVERVQLQRFLHDQGSCHPSGDVHFGSAVPQDPSCLARCGQSSC